MGILGITFSWKRNSGNSFLFVWDNFLLFKGTSLTSSLLKRSSVGLLLEFSVSFFFSFTYGQIREIWLLRPSICFFEVEAGIIDSFLDIKEWEFKFIFSLNQRNYDIEEREFKFILFLNQRNYEMKFDKFWGNFLTNFSLKNKI